MLCSECLSDHFGFLLEGPLGALSAVVIGAASAIAPGCGVAERCKLFGLPIAIVSALGSFPRVAIEPPPSTYAVLWLVEFVISVATYGIFLCGVSERRAAAIVYCCHAAIVVVTFVQSIEDAQLYGFVLPLINQLTVPVQLLCVKSMFLLPHRVNAFFVELVVSVCALGGLALSMDHREVIEGFRLDLDAPTALRWSTPRPLVISLVLAVFCLLYARYGSRCRRFRPAEADWKADAVVPGGGPPPVAVGQPDLGVCFGESHSSAKVGSDSVENAVALGPLGAGGPLQLNVGKLAGIGDHPMCFPEPVKKAQIDALSPSSTTLPTLPHSASCSTMGRKDIDLCLPNSTSPVQDSQGLSGQDSPTQAERPAGGHSVGQDSTTPVLSSCTSNPQASRATAGFSLMADSSAPLAGSCPTNVQASNDDPSERQPDSPEQLLSWMRQVEANHITTSVVSTPREPPIKPWNALNNDTILAFELKRGEQVENAQLSPGAACNRPCAGAKNKDGDNLSDVKEEDLEPADGPLLSVPAGRFNRLSGRSSTVSSGDAVAPDRDDGLGDGSDELFDSGRKKFNMVVDNTGKYFAVGGMADDVDSGADTTDPEALEGASQNGGKPQAHRLCRGGLRRRLTANLGMDGDQGRAENNSHQEMEVSLAIGRQCINSFSTDSAAANEQQDGFLLDADLSIGDLTTQSPMGRFGQIGGFAARRKREFSFLSSRSDTSNARVTRRFGQVWSLRGQAASCEAEVNASSNSNSNAWPESVQEIGEGDDLTGCNVNLDMGRRHFSDLDNIVQPTLGFGSVDDWLTGAETDEHDGRDEHANGGMLTNRTRKFRCLLEDQSPQTGDA